MKILGDKIACRKAFFAWKALRIKSGQPAPVVAFVSGWNAHHNNKDQKTC